MILYKTPITIEMKNNKLIANGEEIESSIRTFSDMKDVLAEEPEEEGDAYYMFRRVFQVNDIRYDITLIPDWTFGEERPKTYGHCHPIAEHGLTYPEVYQLLDGEGVFILQRELRDGSFFVSVVEAKAGDVVLIPPNFCHVSVNCGKALLLANAVYNSFNPDYSLFKRNRGAAYYLTKEGIFNQNPNYIVAKNERITPKQLNARYGFDSEDILTELYSNPRKFEFLKRPSLLTIQQNHFI
ncbi:MAG: glucose-6-phosphate isomerase family protein [Candidatus Bilamarchaeaceae archaeon]